MYRTPHILAIAVAVVLSTVSLKAQTMVGLFSSPKGQGVSAVVPDKNSYALHCIVAYADLSSRLREDSGFVGAMANYSCMIPFYKWTFDDFDIYALCGPGASVGYVKDRGDVPGALAAISAVAGLYFDFERRVSFCLSTNLDLGMHFHRNSQGTVNMSFYSNGILHVIYPQATILISL